MRFSAHKAARRLLLLLAVFCLLPVSAAPPGYAIKMDKAVSSLLLDIASAGDRLVAVGERGHILYSDDGGNSWTQAKVPTTVMLTRVFFLSPELGWAVGHDGSVLASRDGGISWELQRNGIVAQARINEARAGRAEQQVHKLQEQLAISREPDSKKLQQQLEAASNHLEVALADLDDPVFPPPLMDIWFADEYSGWASGAYGTLLRTNNGGSLWEDWSDKVDNPEQLHLNGVTGNPDGTLLLASEWGTIFRSATNGQSWKTIDTGYEGSFFGILSSPATGSVFAYGLRGTVYRSNDNGLNWSALESGVGASLFGAVATADGTLVFVGAGGTVVQSTDDGNSFRLLPQATRLGVYGIASFSNNHYMLTGEGGSRVLGNKLDTGREATAGNAGATE